MTIYGHDYPESILTSVTIGLSLQLSAGKLGSDEFRRYTNLQLAS